MASQGQLPNQEVQIYTWPDATLKELCELLQGVIPNAGNENAKLLLSLVFIDVNGNFGMRQVCLPLKCLYCLQVLFFFQNVVYCRGMHYAVLPAAVISNAF